jgi:hypothetical protein
MAIYRNKPVTVAAEQFFYGKPLPFLSRGPVVKCDGYMFYVETIHGQKVYLADGDWVIIEPGCELLAYPCKANVFNTRYEMICE